MPNLSSFYIHQSERTISTFFKIIFIHFVEERNRTAPRKNTKLLAGSSTELSTTFQSSGCIFNRAIKHDFPFINICES